MSYELLKLGWGDLVGVALIEILIIETIMEETVLSEFWIFM